MTGALVLSALGLESAHASGVTVDQYGNIKAKPTAAAGADWHLDDYVGNKRISVPVGSNGGDILFDGLPIWGKQLWSGSWSSGSITVTDFDKYTAFKIGLVGQGTAILGFRHQTDGTGGWHLRGIGGIPPQHLRLIYTTLPRPSAETRSPL